MKRRSLAPTDLLGPGEVCRLLGINRMQLKRWRDSAGFPSPWRELEIGPVWVAADVTAWAAKR
jgi:predicted DNA-binding transcriptional regulator AlpA